MAIKSAASRQQVELLSLSATIPIQGPPTLGYTEIELCRIGNEKGRLLTENLQADTFEQVAGPGRQSAGVAYNAAGSNFEY